VIDISSDSDVASFGFSIGDYESESDYAPAHPSELMDYLSEKQPLIQLLCHLDSFFPTHEFITFHPIFEEAGINSVHDLTRRTLDWLVEHIGMAGSSAMILLGSAESGVQGESASGGAHSKGKGKAM
jgi:hypothetical protein